MIPLFEPNRKIFVLTKIRLRFEMPTAKTTKGDVNLLTCTQTFSVYKLSVRNAEVQGTQVLTVDLLPVLFRENLVKQNNLNLWKHKNICFRARLKLGWVERVPSCLFGEGYPPRNGVSPSLFLFSRNNGFLVSGLFLVSFHYRRLARVVNFLRPNPPVVQKRDPRTFPRFAVKKKRVQLREAA